MRELGPYKMSSVARLTGFSPMLLRAWEKRYDLLSPVRSPKGHRLYTDRDIQVLRRVKSLLDEGRSIGEIAGLGVEALLAEPLPVPPRHESSARMLEPLVEPGPGGAPSAMIDALVERLVQGAVQMDEFAIETALDQAFARYSVTVAVENVIRPATIRIGELWHEGVCSVTGEHLASQAFTRRLHRLLDISRNRDTSLPYVVTACFPDEWHEFGALLVAFYISQAGARVLHLGASVPFEDLERALGKLDPQAVYLSVMRSPIFLQHKEALLGLARRWGDRVGLHVGGQGVQPDLELKGAGIRVWPPGASIAQMSLPEILKR
ncbi:MAG: MerR family transcriptional regulator [Candidatus Sericytochromatia bacterium]|nr:MerR family transcriptional regulator [Candidatus Sericytochromatia bacterium]